MYRLDLIEELPGTKYSMARGFYLPRLQGLRLYIYWLAFTEDTVICY